MVELASKGDAFIGRNEVGQRLVFLWLAALLVNPLEGPLSLLVQNLVELHDLPHLGIQKSVSYNLFFLLELFGEALALKGHVIEVETQRAKASVGQALLKLLQLLDEGSSDL